MGQVWARGAGDRVSRVSEQYVQREPSVGACLRLLFGAALGLRVWLVAVLG